MLESDQRDETVVIRPWWLVTLFALRFTLGATSLVGGLTWILLNLHSASAVLDVAVGTVLSVGGLILLMPHRVRLPRKTTAVVMTGFALAGTAAGLLVARSQTCCMFAYITDRGWPFHWAQRGAVADDPETAFRVAQSASWTFDLLSLAANLLLFSYVGLIVVVAAVQIRRASR
ncbi:hypothetical protein JIG36_44375 [Actinoplanes sp. LDG1-06]|uniref:Disulfide bond formation protein B n=1 Tax=Paractinoplanes ovalisporus TaxID=2810368 RepID=A0ABS2ARQ6_9ACTN|nr:hypothetical protein [Actinoplanes ovalisporus]MBM2622562.1 hypothetical protein [Actinoplanes ovalisporus]